MPAGTQNTVIPGCGLHHISLVVKNMDVSLDFYRNVLGMKVCYEFLVGERRFALLDMGDGSYVELTEPKPEAANDPLGYAPVAHFALAAHDVRAAIEVARKAGCPVTVEPKDTTLDTLATTVAFFTGPNGESIELFQV